MEKDFDFARPKFGKPQFYIPIFIEGYHDYRPIVIEGWGG